MVLEFVPEWEVDWNICPVKGAKDQADVDPVHGLGRAEAPADRSAPYDLRVAPPPFHGLFPWRRTVEVYPPLGEFLARA